MLVGAGAFMVGLRDRVVNGRAATQAAIAPLDPDQPTDVDRPGLLAGPLGGQPDAAAIASQVVRIEGVGSGSGVVVRDDGIVLTSADVVGNLPDVEVTFQDGGTVTGTNLGGDPVTNVAVVDLPGDGFDAAELVTPRALATGDAVVSSWVSDDGNLVLAAGTLADPQAHVRRLGDEPLDGMLQIARSSTGPRFVPGGPVVDGKGAVLGLATWSDDAWVYATPVDVAAKIADDLLATGAARHGWIGIEGQDAGEDSGVLVTGVTPDGPVSASLRPDDVITELDGEPVADMSALVGLLQLHRPGDDVDVTYERAGEPTDAEITLDVVPDR